VSFLLDAAGGLWRCVCGELLAEVVVFDGEVRAYPFQVRGIRSGLKRLANQDGARLFEVLPCGGDACVQGPRGVGQAGVGGVGAQSL
jgi:hypothetical protein